MATDQAKATADRSFYEDLMLNEKRFVTVPISGWGKSVRMERLSGPERLELLDFQNEFPLNTDGSFAKRSDSLRFAAELLARSIVDEDGGRVFDDEAGRGFLLRQDLPTVVFEAMDAAMDLNDLGQVSVKMEAAKKK